MEWEGDSESLKPNLLAKAGIQVKADQNKGSPIFSRRPSVLECLPPPPEVTGAIVSAALTIRTF